MRAWVRRGVAAVRLGGDRSDLWPAGSLAALAYLGWGTLLLVLAPPNPDSFAFLAITLVTSGSFPLNVLALAVAVVAGFAILCLIAALGEAALQNDASAGERPSLSRAALTGLSVMLLATLPVALATAALALGIINVAPGEFQSPDVATPVLVRVLLDVWPLLVLVAAAMVVGQAFGGVALRLAIGPVSRSVGEAMAVAVRRLVRRPLSHLAVAFASLLKDAVAVLLTYALLRVLWAPISAELGRGRLIAPDTLLLLVGFIAIWLALLLAAGALHVTISAWWALELNQAGGGERPLEAAAPPAA